MYEARYKTRITTGGINLHAHVLTSKSASHIIIELCQHLTGVQPNVVMNTLIFFLPTNQKQIIKAHKIILSYIRPPIHSPPFDGVGLIVPVVSWLMRVDVSVHSCPGTSATASHCQRPLRISCACQKNHTTDQPLFACDRLHCRL